ncbi:MAG TPA: DNA-binding protein [Hadesarchaea archaeon]|nr:DNA-binding protein [Hadesarchaea archaeon]
MKAAEVRPDMRRIELELKVLEVEEPRTYIRRDGKEGRVTTALAEDESGKIKISLWDTDIDRVKSGDHIKITNGYARLFRNEVHVSAGIYGKLEVFGK